MTERNGFDNLAEEQFRKKMQPYAWEIYNNIFHGCIVEDLREEGAGVHILDKEFAIDTILNVETGQYLTVQEKYRANKFLVEPNLRVDNRCPDFTQEYMNAVGTTYEKKGEWFNLAAQLYFYGWANKDETGFERWVILNVPKYKIIVEKAGGLDGVGKLYKNNKCGRANFYAIPIYNIAEAVIWTNSNGLPTPPG